MIFNFLNNGITDAHVHQISSPLLDIPPLPFLDEISLKIAMHIKISNVMVGVYKARNPIFSRLHTHGMTCSIKS
jgi:hypothetical protein